MSPADVVPHPATTADCPAYKLELEVGRVASLTLLIGELKASSATSLFYRHSVVIMSLKYSVILILQNIYTIVLELYPLCIRNFLTVLVTAPVPPLNESVFTITLNLLVDDTGNL